MYKRNIYFLIPINVGDPDPDFLSDSRIFVEVPAHPAFAFHENI